MEVSAQLHAPAALHPRKQPPVPTVGGWVGPRAGLDVMKKRIFSCPYRESNPDSSVVQHVAWPLYVPSYVGI
jgi:hypothetical protein